MKKLTDILYGLRVKIVCDNYNGCFGTLIEVTDTVLPFTVNVDNLGVTYFSHDDFEVVEGD